MHQVMDKISKVSKDKELNFLTIMVEVVMWS